MHDIFMKVPRAAGSCTDEYHEEWINVVGLEWSAHRPAQHAQSQRVGPLSFRHVIVSKPVDAASIPLFRHLTVNTALDEVVIDFVRNGLNDIVELKVVLRNAAVIGIDFAAEGHGPSAHSTERVSFQFEEIEHAYTPVDINGDPTGTLVAVHRLTQAL